MATADINVVSRYAAERLKAAQAFADRRAAQAELLRIRGRRRRIGFTIASMTAIGAAFAAGMLIGDFTPPAFRELMPLAFRRAPVAPVALDPFLKSYTGRVLIFAVYGNDCKQVSFDNRSGRLGELRPIGCDQLVKTYFDRPMEEGAAVARLNSIRDTFGKK